MRAQRGQLSSGLVSGGKQKAPADGGAACGEHGVFSNSSTALLWEGWSSVAGFLEVKSGVGSCAWMQSMEPQQLRLSPGHHP